MMSNLHRPCILPAKLQNVGILTLLGEDDSNDPVVFDAFRFEGLKYESSTSYNPEEYYLVKIYTRPNSVILRYASEDMNIDVLVRQTNYLIQKALNAPVKVTPEWVESVGEKRRSFLFSDGEYVDDLTHWFKHSFNCFTRTDVVLGEQYFVKATCPETLEYLLQFTLDGKRKETK